MDETRIRTRGTGKRNPVREYYTCNWDMRAFLRGKDTISGATRQLGLTDATLHLWMSRTRIPLMAHKALVNQYAPDEAESWRRKLTVTRNKMPSALTHATEALAQEYDRANPGERFALENGGWLTIPDVPREVEVVEPPTLELVHDEPEVEAAPVTVDTPLGPMTMTFPTGTSKIKDTERVLLDMLMLLRHETQQLAYANTELQGRESQLAHQLRSERERVQVLQREVKEWQALAESGGKQPLPVVSNAGNGALADTRVLLQKQAPALVGVLDRLPKAMAH